MAVEKALIVPPDFAKLYREVSLEEDRERLERRFKGVLTLTKSPSFDDVEAIIRTAFHTKQANSPDEIARIRKAFLEADEIFAMDGNDRELQVLCAQALSTLMERDDDISALAALAVTTTAMNGARSLEVPLDLPALAEQAIWRMSEHGRSRPILSERLKLSTPKIDFTAAKEKVQQNWTSPGVQAGLDAVSESVRSALTSINKEVSGLFALFARLIALQDEELQMLWWAIGQRSSDADISFDNVAVEKRPLLFAKELADSTEFLPGPRSAKALLARAGLKEGGKKITIPQAVNACDADWLSSLAVSANASAVSLPIHFAVFRKLETGEETAWIPGWAAVAGVGADYSLPPLSLGFLFYRERLIARRVKE